MYTYQRCAPYDSIEFYCPVSDFHTDYDEDLECVACRKKFLEEFDDD